MKKLIRGIVDFRQKVLPDYRQTFAELALGQKPDTLFIACSDSRVVPNLFASSNPGDLFVIRNVGNLISPCGVDGLSVGDVSEAAAIEFSLQNLPVRDVIVCGHSECGAMVAVSQAGSNQAGSNSQPHLVNWLRHAKPSLARVDAGEIFDPHLAKHNQLSQLNVLQQIEHLKTYSHVADRLKQGTLRLHGWWFDIRHADVYAFDPQAGRFLLIDADYAEVLLARFHSD